MSTYKFEELREVLAGSNVFLDEEESTDTSMIWYTSGGFVFPMPVPIAGRLEADVIDFILADRQIPKPLGKPKRY